MNKSKASLYRGGIRPTGDQQLFESMTKVIFRAGLNWKVIDIKWGAFRKAFAGFEVNKVASFTETDVQRLMNNAELIRNEQKIRATIENAREFQKIAAESGTFGRFLDHILHQEGVQKTMKALRQRFNRLGRTSARMFLYMVGVNIAYTEE